MTQTGLPATDSVAHRQQAVGADGPRAARAHPLLWCALLPLMLLLHPYGGLVQDARIYIGRGVADHDPAGVGRDIVFADDAQTGFTLLRPVIRALLDVLSPGAVSMVLALAGTILWLLAAVALLRRLAGGRNAWAAAVAVLALSARYGAFDAFGYAEAVATPRVFAEAAVLGGLAALLGRHRPVGLALMALAFALHPLMALPGLAVAALLLIHDDRRWAIPVAAVGVAVLAAAALKLPLAERLVVSIDAEWWSILRRRSLYLFPTCWPAEVFAQAAAQAAAAIVAGSLMASRERVILWGATGVATAGVVLSLCFGDLLPDLLVTQLQPWRALWPLAVLGNAALALTAIASWRLGGAERVVLALLIAAWVTEMLPALSLASSGAALGLMVAARFGRPVTPSRSVALAALAAAGVLVAREVADDVGALVSLMASAAEQGGEMTWPYVAAAGIHAAPLVASAVAAARLPLHPSRLVALTGTAALAILAGAAILLWDGRTAEWRAVEAGSGGEVLRAALGSAAGEVLWIDEGDENWFLLGRPAFFNSLQGAPILFSRAMALDWASRGHAAIALGLARPADLAPWTATASANGDLALAPAALDAFCADARHPVGLVAPGDQRAAVPPHLTATLWRPPSPFHRLTVAGDGFHWRSIAVFTTVRCAA